MRPIIEMELVYSLQIEDGFAYAVAKVELFPEGDDDLTIVTVDRYVTPVELDGILKSFESDVLQKIGVELEDYKTIVDVNGEKHEPVFGNDRKVIALEKL